MHSADGTRVQITPPLHHAILDEDGALYSSVTQSIENLGELLYVPLSTRTPISELGTPHSPMLVQRGPADVHRRRRARDRALFESGCALDLVGPPRPVHSHARPGAALCLGYGRAWTICRRQAGMVRDQPSRIRSDATREHILTPYACSRFLLVLIPAGPSAMLLVTVAELVDINQGAIAGYLTIAVRAALLHICTGCVSS